MDINNPGVQKCDRCHAVDKKIHPLHGFEVRLETVEYKGKTQNLCQRCKIQVEVKKKKLSDSDQKNKNQLSDIFNRIFKSK